MHFVLFRTWSGGALQPLVTEMSITTTNTNEVERTSHLFDRWEQKREGNSPGKTLFFFFLSQ